MKEYTQEKLQELQNNPEFIAKLRESRTSEDILAVMAEYGIEITEEEYEAGMDQAMSILEDQGYLSDGELTEAGLDLVAGGFNSFISGAGIVSGGAGVMLMMAGGGPAVWAAGCTIGLIGLVAPGKKKKKKKSKR